MKHLLTSFGESTSRLAIASARMLWPLVYRFFAAIATGFASLPGLRRRVGVWALLLLLVFMLLPQDLLARRGGRISFGRSSSFSRRSAPSYSSRAKTWGSTRSSSATPRMGSRGASRTAQTPSYGVDQSVVNRARTQGTVFNSRGDAQRAFERDNASKFPSTFSREPSTRPSYIPPTTTVDGRNYDVSFNPRYGGYGYMQNGSWVAYSALRDITMLSLLMRQGSYVYPQGGANANADGAYVGDARTRSGFGMGTGILVLLLIVGAWAMIPKRRGAQRYYQGGATPLQRGGRGWPPADAPGTLQPNIPRESSMTTDFDLHSARFWRTLRPGSTVILKDEQTLADMISGGEALATGRDYNLEEVWRIRESRDIAEWQFFRIRSPHDEDATWLMIKSAGDEMSAGVYFEADGFQSGNRENLLQQELYWVFAEPRDANNYRVLDLQFAPHLYFNVDVNGEEKEVEFAKMGNLEFHGNATADPPIANASFTESNRMVGTVAEYQTMLPVPNPKVVFFEAGVPNEQGGLIRMLQGSDIPVGDIEVLPLNTGSVPSSGRS